MRRSSAPAFAVLALAAVGLTGCGGDRVVLELEGGGDSRRGPDAIAAHGCGSCHEVPGVRGADGQVGPPLTDFGRRSYIAGRLPNTAENLVRWIMDPQDVDPRTAMPDLDVGEDDARDLAAYLSSLGR